MSPDDRGMGAVDAISAQLERELERAGDLGLKLSFGDRVGCMAVSLLAILAAQAVVQSELLELILASNERGTDDDGA